MQYWQPFTAQSNVFYELLLQLLCLGHTMHVYHELLLLLLMSIYDEIKLARSKLDMAIQENIGHTYILSFIFFPVASWINW